MIQCGKVYDMEERMEGQKILIVEDDADISGLLVKIMEGAGYQVRQVIFRNRGIVLYGTGITGLCAVGSDASGDDREKRCWSRSDRNRKKRCLC